MSTMAGAVTSVLGVPMFGYVIGFVVAGKCDAFGSGDAVYLDSFHEW
ncbi:hypothetical protein [Rugosimonospora africana]|nr:hypothetical protein [Rugosimonospora africana]